MSRTKAKGEKLSGTNGGLCPSRRTGQAEPARSDSKRELNNKQQMTNDKQQSNAGDGIHRNIILDLLPAYVGGEASAETRDLVEEFSQSDPSIAQLIRAGGLSELPSHSIDEKQSSELKALQRVKRRVNKQSWYLGLAIFFTLFAVTFNIGPDGIHWTWYELPRVAVLSCAFAVFFWLGYAQSRKRI